ncbi:DUF3180 domain-containing protein [Jatrophihabitans fulvus]
MTRPGMQRTGWRELVLPAVVVGGLVYLLLRYAYDSMPPLQLLVPVPVAALAVAEFVAARRVRAAVRHDPDAKPMAAIVIARCVALGKASSIVGAGVGGAALALLARVFPDVGTVDAAGHDAIVATAMFVACVLLVGAGLWLERAGLDPNRDRRP